MEEVLDVIVKEQLINTLASDMRIWVKERNPNTSEKAGQLAENYTLAWSQHWEDKKRPQQFTTRKERVKQQMQC